MACIGCKINCPTGNVCAVCEAKGRAYVANAVDSPRIKCLSCARKMTPAKLAETHGYCRYCRTRAAKPTPAEKPVARKREKINSALRYQIWITYASATMLHSECYCCYGLISYISFHCGHIVSDADGGHANVENLRPVCASCNLSMGTENMRDFVKRCGFRNRFAEECIDDVKKKAIERQLTADGIKISPSVGDFVIVNVDDSDDEVSPEFKRMSIDDSSTTQIVLRWLRCCLSSDD